LYHEGRGRPLLRNAWGNNAKTFDEETSREKTAWKTYMDEMIVFCNTIFLEK
jgi:hypothetical protein